MAIFGQCETILASGERCPRAANHHGACRQLRAWHKAQRALHAVARTSVELAQDLPGTSNGAVLLLEVNCIACGLLMTPTTTEWPLFRVGVHVHEALPCVREAHRLLAASGGLPRVSVSEYADE